ncbi:MAG: hypothetical protein ACD_46C00017G0001, partial [uncultured bacterium]
AKAGIHQLDSRFRGNDTIHMTRLNNVPIFSDAIHLHQETSLVWCDGIFAQEKRMCEEWRINENILLSSHIMDDFLL